MTTIFQIDEEINKLVDKFSEELKLRLKKAVMRSEKLVLKQYMASQRETAKAKKSSKITEVKVVTSPKKNSGSSSKSSSSKNMSGSPPRQKTSKSKGKREQDYIYYSDDE